MQIVMLRGWSCSGKDTAATLLQELDSGYVRFAFANALKEMVAERYASDGYDALAALYTQEGKAALCPIAGVSWRTLLLRVGAEERSKNPDVFAELTANRISTLPSRSPPLLEAEEKVKGIPEGYPFRSHPQTVIITDWRYPNEYDVIRRRFPEADLRTVWVRRLDQETSPVQHYNESLLDSREDEHVLINPPSIDGFRAAIRQLYERLQGT